MLLEDQIQCDVTFFELIKKIKKGEAMYTS